MRTLLAESLRRHRVLATLALAHFALFVILVPAALVDTAQIQGISRWIKPMKFAMSISIFLMSMAWILSVEENRRRAATMFGVVIGFAMTAEMLLVTMQAARGVRSHFNFASAFDKMVFDAMGLLILTNTLAMAAVLALFLFRQRNVSPVLLTGIRAGLFLFIVASFVGALIVQRGAHTVGAPDGGPGLPFVNWSTRTGDLRVAHFFGMHALQALPLLALFLERKGVRSSQRWVRIVATALLIGTLGLLFQALSGNPFPF